VDRGLSIRVTEGDVDYLGLELRASSARFAATTFLCAGHERLGELADALAGFPAGAADECSYAFGKRGPSYAGGYCRLRLSSSPTGLSTLEVSIEDAGNRFPAAQAEFSIAVEPAQLDRFVEALRGVARSKQGEAFLGLSA
jgi:hypothetical protein